jgi:hypothetical protein
MSEEAIASQIKIVEDAVSANEAKYFPDSAEFIVLQRVRLLSRKLREADAKARKFGRVSSRGVNPSALVAMNETMRCLSECAALLKSLGIEP